MDEVESFDCSYTIHPLGQEQDRLRHLLLHRTDGNPHTCRDLSMTVALDAMQQKYLARTRTQLIQPCTQAAQPLLPENHVVRCRTRLRKRKRLYFCKRDRTPTRAPANVVRDHVDDGAYQKSLRLLYVSILSVALQSEERFLDRFVGLVTGPAATVQQFAQFQGKDCLQK